MYWTRKHQNLIFANQFCKKEWVQVKWHWSVFLNFISLRSWFQETVTTFLYIQNFLAIYYSCSNSSNKSQMIILRLKQNWDSVYLDLFLLISSFSLGLCYKSLVKYVWIQHHRQLFDMNKKYFRKQQAFFLWPHFTYINIPVFLEYWCV